MYVEDQTFFETCSKMWLKESKELLQLDLVLGSC